MAILGSHLGKTYCHTLLTGEGADELFFGYDQFRIALAQQGHFGNLTDLDWSSFGHPEFSLGGKDPRIHWKTLIALTSRQSIVPLPNVKPYLRFDPDMLQRRSEPQSEGHDLRKNLIMGILSSYLLPVQAYAALSWYGIDSRSPYLSTEVARWAFSRKIQDEVSITGGKQSLRALLAHLKTADGRSLASLVRPKQAYRVETDLVRSSEYAWERLVSLAGSCSNPLLRADVVVRRAKSLPLTSSVPESLSMMLILCASLAILES